MSKKNLSPEIPGSGKKFRPFLIVVYSVCIVLTILSIFPFLVMFINATRSTTDIQAKAISFIPGGNLSRNWSIIKNKGMFDAWAGFKNSCIISFASTFCAVYFSTLTAYSVVVYDWKFKNAFFTFVLAIMIIPGQVVSIGFYKMVYSVGLTNNFLPLIIPSIQAPATVFFMRQYMVGALSMEIVQSARIDGAREFRIFNTIALPIMKPAIATQAIFSFVSSWNQLFMPMILLKDKTKFTMPCMISLLKGDIYKVEYGSIYLGLSLTVLPLFVIYFALSKYIIAGVALGSVKG